MKTITAVALALISLTAVAAESKRISDVEIAIKARECLAKNMTLYVVRENGKPVAATCINETH